MSDDVERTAAPFARGGDEPLFVACLCAEWCTTCVAYRELLREVTGHAIHWVDIEDHADLLEPIDVETFPTLLVARGGEALFFGPVAPTVPQLRLLLERAAAGTLRPSDTDDAETALVRLTERVRELVRRRPEDVSLE